MWRLVFLALETGGRISELLSLREDDIDLKSARILFRGISTKSGRNRYVPLHPDTVKVIERWKVYPCFIKSGRPDLNRRPPAPKADKIHHANSL